MLARYANGSMALSLQVSISEAMVAQFYHPQRNRQIVLPGIGCEFSEQLARFHFTGGHRSRTTEEIRPVCNNQFLADFATGADPITTFWNATSEFLPPEENRGCSATPLTEPRRASDL